MKGNMYVHKTGSYVIRCKVPWRDVGHLYKFTNDLRTPKQPRKWASGEHKYADFWVTNKELYNLLQNPDVDMRHWTRGLIDGRGIIDIQKKYLRIRFRGDKSTMIRDYLCKEVGRVHKPKISDDKITFVGSSAVKIARYLYTSQTRCLQRKFDKVAPFLFG